MRKVIDDNVEGLVKGDFNANPLEILNQTLFVRFISLRKKKLMNVYLFLIVDTDILHP